MRRFLLHVLPRGFEDPTLWLFSKSRKEARSSLVFDSTPVHHGGRATGEAAGANARAKKMSLLPARQARSARAPECRTDAGSPSHAPRLHLMIRSRFTSRRLAPTASRLLRPTCHLTWPTWSGLLIRSERTNFGALIMLTRSLSKERAFLIGGSLEPLRTTFKTHKLFGHGFLPVGLMELLWRSTSRRA